MTPFFRDVALGAILALIFVPMALFVLALLPGCGGACESFEVDVNTTTEDEVLVDEACFTTLDDGSYDLSARCPAGYSAAGFNAALVRRHLPRNPR